MKIINGGTGFSSPMTEQEVKDFLSNSKLNIHLGTLDEKGLPNIHPAWYYFDPSNNSLYVNTARNSKKASNSMKNQNVYFCIDEPNQSYKGVRGRGQVKIQEDISHNIPIAKIMAKYLGSLAHPAAITIMDFVRNGSYVMLEITPSYFSTWDHNKIT